MRKGDVWRGTQSLVEHGVDPRGAPEEWIHLVGNVMIDTLLANLETARERGAAAKERLDLDRYGLMTLHRPSNVDEAEAFGRLLKAIGDIDPEVPVLFPVHLRAAKLLDEFGWSSPSTSDSSSRWATWNSSARWPTPRSCSWTLVVCRRRPRSCASRA